MSSKILALKVGLILAVVCLSSQAAFAADKDNNPPGPKGGPGSNWENKPGPQGGPGAGPNRHWDRDNNPPGLKGGPGTNWEKNDYPKGWEQGKKEGWNGQDMPPGQYKEHPKHPKPNIDFNHDGVVDESEKKTAYEKYIAPDKAKREEWKEKREDRKEKREEKREAWKDRVDSNDDGKVDKVERHQARKEWKENHPGAASDRKPAPKN